jgi:hypothetical protein
MKQIKKPDTAIFFGTYKEMPQRFHPRKSILKQGLFPHDFSIAF